MVLSMTGYGRAGALLHGRDIKVELRSVNARFFEYSSRLPRSCAFLEDKLKKLVASKVSRGKVELSLSIQTVTAADTVVTVNWQLAEGYRAALNAMAERMDLKNDVSVGMLSRFPDVLTQTAAPTNEDELWEDVRTVAEQAVDAFVAMRAVEGEKMKADVAGRLTTIETLVAKIEENSAGRVQAYSDKLYARLQELLGGLPRSRPCRAWPSRCTTATRPLPALPPSEANSSAACMPRAPTASCPARTAFCRRKF